MRRRKKDGRRGAGPARIPANEIEELVMSKLTELLQSAKQMMDILSDSSSKPDALQRSMEAIQTLVGGSQDMASRILKSAVSRIVVHDERVEIELSKYLLRREILGQEIDAPKPVSNDEADTLTLKAYAKLKRCGGEVRFLLPPDSNHGKLHPVQSLIRAVARAHDWVDQIMTGEAKDQRALTEKTGLDERYIGRIIRLAFLAPDLTEAVLEGTHSAHLSLARFLGNVPADWRQQRARLKYKT